MFNNILNIAKAFKTYKNLYIKKNIFTKNLIVLCMAKINGSVRVQIDFLGKLISSYKITGWVYNHTTMVLVLYTYLFLYLFIEIVL